MHYNHVVRGIFKDRPNRFIAHVYVGDILETVHVKNTGRCRELLIPGAKVILEKSDNPSRKTQYDLIAVYKEGLGLINMDSQAPNKVVYEWLQQEEYFKNMTYIKPECTYGESRMDFYFEYGGRKAFMEVKGVTLEVDGVGYFPDAPTERGIKHLRELEKAVSEGYEAYLAFVIQMPGVEKVLSNAKMHKEFAKAYKEAVQAGVKVLHLQTKIQEDAMRISSINISDGIVDAKITS